MNKKRIYSIVIDNGVPALLETKIELDNYPSITASSYEVITESECESRFDDWLDGADELWKEMVYHGDYTDSLDDFINTIKDEGFEEHLDVKSTWLNFNDEDVYLDCLGSGCQHELIEKSLPQLKPIIDLHLGGSFLNDDIKIGSEKLATKIAKNVLNKIELPKDTKNEVISKLLKYKMCQDCVNLVGIEGEWICEDENQVNVKNVSDCYVWKDYSIKAYNFDKREYVGE